MKHFVFTLADRPDLRADVDRINREAWPEFAFHDPVAACHWNTIVTTLAHFQVALVDASGTVVAAGNTVPLHWDRTLGDLPSGWDGVIERGCSQFADGVVPNTLSALAAIVDRKYLGQGWSKHVILAVRDLAESHGFSDLLAPVRPNLKSRYPLTPFDRYLTWIRSDGRVFDPWLRVHASLMAETIRVAPESMTIPGTIAEWETWTDMVFPETGTYIVPGALVPVTMDRERDRGLYVEPNVWMRHRVGLPLD